jgi:hypothetical protein
MVACAALLAALLGGVGTAKVDSTSWAALSKPATICGDADHSESCWDLLGDGQVEVESGGCARGCCTGCSSGVLLSLGMSKHTRGETKCATHISSEPRTKPAAGASAHSRARAPRRNHLLLSRGISATIYYALARRRLQDVQERADSDILNQRHASLLGAGERGAAAGRAACSRVRQRARPPRRTGACPLAPSGRTKSLEVAAVGLLPYACT